LINSFSNNCTETMGILQEARYERGQEQEVSQLYSKE